MTDEHITEPITHERDKDDPIGELKLPGRPKFGARAMALAGSSAGLGFAVVFGTALSDTSWTPTPWTR